MRPIILCFSRSYLAHLIPEISRAGEDLDFVHIVQTEGERRIVEQKGGTVVAVLETEVRKRLAAPDGPVWKEPDDFRNVTKFEWDPTYCDRYLPEFEPKLRARIAGALFETLEDVFRKTDVAAILSEPVAIFPTHLLFYLIKKKGGASLLWAGAFFPGWLYFSDSVPINTPHRYAADDKFCEEELKTQISDYIARVAQDTAGPAYHHKFAEKRFTAWDYFSQRRGENARVYVPGIMSVALQTARLARTWMAKLLFPRLYDYMAAASVNEHAFYLRCLLGRRKSYDNPPPDYAHGNVFFPLQFEPEASLLYAAPHMRDQKAVIESICQALPEGHLLWVKEHPNQFGALSMSDWTKLRRRYHNLRFVYGRDNGREVIKSCGLAVAITSTAGLDALILGRKTIVLGDVYYRNFPGAIAVNSFSELAVALNDHTNYGIGDFKSGMIEAASKLGSKCYPGSPSPSARLYDPANLSNLYRAIASEVAAKNGQPV